MNKKSNILKIFAVILCLCAVTVFALIQSGANPAFVQSYKNNFKRNISAICNKLHINLPIETQLYLDDMSEPTPKPTMIPAAEQEALDAALGYPSYEEPEEAHGTDPLTAKQPKKTADGNFLPIAFSAAENTKFTDYKGSIICVNETLYQAYSPSGKLLWSQGIQMQSPILKVKGDYVLICETGAKKVSLYKGKKLVFGTKTDGDIITASLSENGDVVAVTEKESYKAQVVVFNKSGKKIFAWDSGTYDVLDAAISNNWQVALSLLDTDTGADTLISCMDVKGNTRYKTEPYKDTLFFSIDYSGEKLTAMSESKYIGISSKGKQLWEYNFEGKKPDRFTKDTSGNMLILFETQSTGALTAVSPGGKVYASVQTESMPDSIDIKSGKLAYNSGREVVITDFNGKKKRNASCDSDVKQIHILNSGELLCVYSSSIQIKKTETKETAKPSGTQIPEMPVSSENPQDNQQQ